MLLTVGTGLSTRGLLLGEGGGVTECKEYTSTRRVAVERLEDYVNFTGTVSLANARDAERVPLVS